MLIKFINRLFPQFDISTLKFALNEECSLKEEQRGHNKERKSVYLVLQKGTKVPKINSSFNKWLF